MRGLVYLLSLVVAVGGAVYFGDQGRPVLAVMALVPGYFVVAYVLILVLTFLPGAERRRFETARADAFGGSTPQHPRGLDLSLPPETPLHPAYVRSRFETLYTGDGFLAWPESDQRWPELIFRSVDAPRSRYAFKAYDLGGFAIEPDVPEFLGDGAFITGGPVVRLDGDPDAAMASVWVQPADAGAFADRLRAARVPDLADVPGQDESST